MTKNQPTSGNVPNGGLVEKAAPGEFGKGPVVFQLKQPDFTTASRVAAAIDKELGGEHAKALNPASIEVGVSEVEQKNPVAFVARLESSGAFKGSGEAGSSMSSGLFAGVLADAIAGSGGLGLARQFANPVTSSG